MDRVLREEGAISRDSIGVHISTVHLDILVIIHDCKWIAALYSWYHLHMK